MTDSPVNGHDISRLVAEHRERLINLEADGVPDDGHEPWDVLAGILAELKRHQGLIER